jgi:hypothetical protein
MEMKRINVVVAIPSNAREKQSSGEFIQNLDCRVAALLAMTTFNF